MREERRHAPRSALLCGRAWTAAIVGSVLFLLLAGLGDSAFAQIDSCSDRNPSGQLECTYRPHIIDPWKYLIPGPLKGTRQYLDEKGAKDEYDRIWYANCPNCCEYATLINQSDWKDRSDAITWLPDMPGWADKTLTFRVTPRNADGTCGTSWTFTATLSRFRRASCELGWSGGTASNQSYCYRSRRNAECRIGHPISLPHASKVFTESDYVSPVLGGLAFVRDYRSDGFSYPVNFSKDLWADLGNTWTHNYAGYLTNTGSAIWVSWGQEPPQHFSPPGGSGYPRSAPPIRPDQRNRLVEFRSGSYAYYTAKNELVLYEGGVPVGVYLPSGAGVQLTYAEGQVSAATDAFGRQLQFGYDGKRHLVSVRDPVGQQIVFGYKLPTLDSRGGGGENVGYTTLSSVTFQDGGQRRYQVPDWPLYDSGAEGLFATRIQGVVDESGVLYESVKYHSYGAAASSELAGGVEKYVVSGTSIIDPLGTVRNLNFDATAAAPSSFYQPAGSGCPASNSYRSYDASGNLTSSDDYRGSRTCYANNSSRNIEMSRVEGLSQYTSCSTYAAEGAQIPVGARRTSTQWHPEWRLQTKVAEPGRITTYVYNGQPDPFNGGAAASCAASSALLPDGKPIAVLCKQVEQATTDADGHLGFSAALQSGVAARMQQWTYNEYGQVLTATDPRGNTSSYSYYSDTTADHTRGDLQQVVDAAGLVTQYPRYNPHGQVLQMVDANGVATDYTYDPRQRLTSVSSLGQSTVYEYWPTGLLKKLTLPDGSYVRYDYDDAHRLTDVSDGQGNGVHYTLDNAGNRTKEETKDASGALARQMSRSIDALNRVQQTTGRN